MPQVRIPREFERTRRKLVAVPELEWRRLLRLREIRDREYFEVQEALADVRAGRVIQADSIDDAIEKARARGWLDDED